MPKERLIVSGEPCPQMDRLIAQLRKDGFEVEVQTPQQRLLAALREVRGEETEQEQLELFK